MKEKYIHAHMRAAYVYASLSSCERRKVGCVIVKHNSIIAIGYNGTNPGECNNCENDDGVTLPQVRHAEDNALRKLTRSSTNANNASVFVTTVPCKGCASRLVDAGVKHVYYDELYHSDDGVKYLTSHGVKVTKVNL